MTQLPEKFICDICAWQPEPKLQVSATVQISNHKMYHELLGDYVAPREEEV